MDLRKEALPLGAVEFALLRRFLLETKNLAADFSEQRLFLVGRATGLDAPEPMIGGGVGKGVELLGKSQLFDAALVQARAASASGQRGEEIKRGRIGMVKAANGPAERDAAQLRGKFAAKFPALVLVRFVREEEIGHLAARIFLEKFRRAG